VGCYAGTLSKTHAKAGQHHAEMKDHFVDDVEWFSMSLLIRWLYHFATDFDCVLLHLMVSDIANILFKYRVSYRQLTLTLKHMNCWWKSLKIRFVVCEYLMCHCTFTWKSELKSLNCCIGGTTKVISIKSAVYVV